MDIQKLSRSIDYFNILVEHLFNEEKNINKFMKLKNILNILRILMYQLVSLIVCTCISSILFKHTRVPICIENIEKLSVLK